MEQRRKIFKISIYLEAPTASTISAFQNAKEYFQKADQKLSEKICHSICQSGRRGQRLFWLAVLSVRMPSNTWGKTENPEGEVNATLSYATKIALLSMRILSYGGIS